MADIRLVRPGGSRVWVWVGLIVALCLGVLTVSAFLGDPTEAALSNRVGAGADFGANRAPVIPVVVTPFPSVSELTERDVGRLVHLEGWAASGVRRNVVWVRASDGRRILVRFEPAPPEGERIPVAGGGRVIVDGYLQRIAEAELRVTLDSLGVALPRPRPSVKFGDLPDSSFIRVDSLFVKNYYISVRPRAAATQAPASSGS